jgi:hypothetical protein
MRYMLYVGFMGALSAIVGLAVINLEWHQLSR